MDRRRFLAVGAAMAASVALPGGSSARIVKATGPLKKKKPERALIVWYSQTGHTERYARLIARCWEKQGLSVDAVPMKRADRSLLARYDLITVGTPVQYLDVPQNVQDWLARVPSIPGTGIAGYVSFGGKGDGQHNAAVSLLDTLTRRGGVPLGMGTFGNMSAYPPTWSMGYEARTLAFRDKPDQATYAQVRRLAADVLDRYGRGRGIEVKDELSFMGLFKGGISRGVAKATIGRHEIDPGRCIHCGACVDRCPVGAIDLAVPRVDTRRCILCFGCLNNCPTGAHEMTVFGRKIYSFAELLRRNGITLKEPPELV